MEGSVEFFQKHSLFCFASFFQNQIDPMIHGGKMKTLSMEVIAFDRKEIVSNEVGGSV